MMRKNLRQTVLKSFGRYIAIAVIIALGAGMFVGLRSTRNDMVATGQRFADEQNMFDLRFLTSYGWGEEQLEKIRKLDGITDAEGLFYMDLIVGEQAESADSVYRFYSIPNSLNLVSLQGGRMPTRGDECLADGYKFGAKALGTQITVSADNDSDMLEHLNYQTFTVVGYVASPLYMDMNRGNTAVGNGSISACIYIPDEALAADYYTEIHAVLPGDYAIYTTEYNDAMKRAADDLEPELQTLANERLEQVRAEAEREYDDGLTAYKDGREEFEKTKEETDKKIHDAFQELLDGEDTLRRSEEKLKNGKLDLDIARVTLSDNRLVLSDSRKTLAKTRADTYEQMSQANEQLVDGLETVSKNQLEIQNGLIQVNSGIAELDSGILQVQLGLNQIDMGIQQLQTLINVADLGLSAAETALRIAEESGADSATIEMFHKKLDEYYETKEAYSAQLDDLKNQRAELSKQLDTLNFQRSELINKKTELETAQAELQKASSDIEKGFATLISQQTMAEKQFAAAEAQIQAGESQIDAYEKTLDLQEKMLEEGREDLENGKQEWRDGFRKYMDGKKEAKEEFCKAEQELRDAEQELQDARKTIDDMVQNDVIILDRNSNVGYCSLDSSSNIVAGVSRVFPVFFLLVAALVCITTMTRMVDDERTQIGTLKALGYGNWAIISKYLFYAGSSAIIGCTVGVLLGSVVFPVILWEAYKIMIYITPQITLRFDWALCIGVVAVYTAVMLLVTWNCCRKELEDVPAELIRPKAPSVGKSLIFERFRVWNKINFLNKVAIRNIFRYRQRLAMMLLGIGGCTALLLTGFGLRDSIMNIVGIQFNEVTKYDIEVYFKESCTQQMQSDFRSEVKRIADDVLFFSQSSVEMDAGGKTQSISLIVSSEEISDYIDFHKGNHRIELPGEGRVLLSSGVADMIGLKVGDAITLRNFDLEEMQLIVSGIYDNHVYNYAIVNQGTFYDQMGREPENQMAYVKLVEGKDAHEAGALLHGLDGIMNVSVNEELAQTVSGMMAALNLVVLVIVFCAGLLAFIVLYNLTNINITERIREIATIKVLGFNAMETAMYVFKENFVLSVMGSGLGLVLGRLLLRFVISQIKIDMLWMEPRLAAVSYLWSIVLTLFMSILVDLVFYFRLERINMAEALKSVE